MSVSQWLNSMRVRMISCPRSIYNFQHMNFLRPSEVQTNPHSEFLSLSPSQTLCHSLSFNSFNCLMTRLYFFFADALASNALISISPEKQNILKIRASDFLVESLLVFLQFSFARFFCFLLVTIGLLSLGKRWLCVQWTLRGRIWGRLCGRKANWQ